MNLMKLAMVAMVSGFMALTGCNSKYVDRYGYAPRPGEVSVDLPTTPGNPDARVLANVSGILRRVEDRPGARGVEIRVRVENTGNSLVIFNPSKSTLVSSALYPLIGPVNPSNTVMLAPGEQANLVLVYRLGPGLKVDSEAMRGLNLRLSLQIGDEQVTRSFTFSRVYDYWSGSSFYGGYGYSSYPYHYGYGLDYRYR